ncbi:hypothetical protein C9F07_01165, partial [Salmonella enterica subsp. enterica serovar Poona]
QPASDLSECLVGSAMCIRHSGSWLRKFSLGFRPSLDGPIITASFFGRTLFDVICMDNRS